MTLSNYKKLKADNARLNLAELHALSTELASLPLYLMVELTQGCNLRCPMCRSETIAYAERKMDRQLLLRLSELLFPTADMVDIRGWGESLLAPDIDDVIRLVARYEARCRVVTNLSLNRPKTLDLLSDVGAMVDVSLDVADQVTLDKVRTGAKLELITRNLLRLVQRQAGSSAADLRIIATLQRATLAGLSDLVRYAASVGVRCIVLNEVTLSPNDSNAVCGLEAEVDDSVGRAREVANDLGVQLFAGSAIGTCVGVTKSGPACIHPWSYATIGYDGSVGFCDHLVGPMMPLYCMGDVTVDAFRDIWNGSEWQALRHWHALRERADTPRYRACYRCYQHRNVDFEDMFEPKLSRYRLTVL